MTSTEQGEDLLGEMRERCEHLAADVASYGVRSVPPELRRRHLLACAHVLFIEQGYADTSMADVATMAGVTKPVIYSQFSSKEDLFRACMADSDEELASRTTAAVRAEPDPGRRIFAAGYAYFEYVRERRPAWSRLLRTDPGPVREWEIRIRERQAHDLATRLARERRARSDADRLRVDALSQMITGAAEALAAWWTTQPGVTLEEISTIYAEAMASAIDATLRSGHAAVR